MWFWFFLVSLCVNILFLFYLRWLLKTLAIINQDTENLTLIIKDFSKHLEGIHELEMFYGDETLKGLIEHSKIYHTEYRNYRFSFTK
jgi:hypothetical protein